MPEPAVLEVRELRLLVNAARFENQALRRANRCIIAKYRRLRMVFYAAIIVLLVTMAALAGKLAA